MLHQIQSPLIPLPDDSSAEATAWPVLGAAVQLAMAHEDFAEQRLHVMMERFTAAMETGQAQLLLDGQRRPWAFACWILVNDGQHESWLGGDTTLPDQPIARSDSNAHQHLWFVDFIVPFGNQLQALQHLKAMFPGHESAWAFSPNNDLTQQENQENLPPRRLW